MADDTGESGRGVLQVGRRKSDCPPRTPGSGQPFVIPAYLAEFFEAALDEKTNEAALMHCRKNAEERQALPPCYWPASGRAVDGGAGWRCRRGKSQSEKRRASLRRTDSRDR